MTAMLSGLAVDEVLGPGISPDRPVVLRFEAAAAVDDLVVATRSTTLYVNAKRSLNLSSEPASEFASVMAQFATLHAVDPDGDSAYILATTPVASSKITRELRKLCEARRLNETDGATNPLNASEARTLATTTALLRRRFAEHAGRSLTDDGLDGLLRRVHVVVLDLERGGSMERAVQVVLSARAAGSPDNVWRALIGLALSLAKDRASVDQAGLEQRTGQLFAEAAASIGGDDGPIVEGPVMAGREVLLADLYGTGPLLIAELFRFADDGERRVRFSPGKVTLRDGRSWTVLRRAATKDGLVRLIEADPAVLDGREVVIAPLADDADPEATPWARAHAEALTVRAAAAGGDLLVCLRCARPVAEHRAPFVEIDQDDAPHQVGTVHTACLLPADRALGQIGLQGPDLGLPDDFDHRAWLKAAVGGQGMFNALPAVLRAGVLQVGWKPGNRHLNVGTWGVVNVLDDGAEQYWLDRGQVLAFTRDQADDAVDRARRQLALASDAGDPLSALDDGNGAFAPYSVLLRTTGQTPRRVVDARPRPLTRADVLANARADSYYAPLLVLVDRAANTPFRIAEAYVLLTDPLRLADLRRGWEAAGVDLPDFATAVLTNDDQFDAFVAAAYLQGASVVVDPVLDLAGQPVSAIVIAPLDLLMQQAQEAAGDDTADDDTAGRPGETAPPDR